MNEEWLNRKQKSAKFSSNLKKEKYIAWIHSGCEGWYPTYCKTLEEAIDVESYGSDKIITKKIEYKIEEIK